MPSASKPLETLITEAQRLRIEEAVFKMSKTPDRTYVRIMETEVYTMSKAGQWGEAKLYERSIGMNDVLDPVKHTKHYFDTLLHEVAHHIAYLCAGHHGHGKPWKQVMELLQQPVQRCSAKTPELRAAVGDPNKERPFVCSTCGEVQMRHPSYVRGFNAYHKPCKSPWDREAGKLQQQFETA